MIDGVFPQFSHKGLHILELAVLSAEEQNISDIVESDI